MVARTKVVAENEVELPEVGQLEEFSMQLILWSEVNLRKFPWRKRSISNFQKIVSEILLQRTRAETVEAFYDDFFGAFPSWRAIYQSNDAKLEAELKHFGMYKKRAASLKSLAAIMLNKNGRFPSLRDDIDKLPGIGQYIANSIELLIYGRPVSLLDVNMARLLERYFGPRKLADIRYDPRLQKLSAAVVRISHQPVLINWAILDFASLVCKKKNPACEACCLSRGCLSYNNS